LDSDGLHRWFRQSAFGLLVGNTFAERLACMLRVTEPSSGGVRHFLPVLLSSWPILWNVRTGEVTHMGEPVGVNRFALGTR
jgi:hypothetical protein